MSISLSASPLRHAVQAALIGLTLWLSGCATAPPPVSSPPIPRLQPQAMQEINRYADSEFRYADKSDEAAIAAMVREMQRSEEAKRRYLEGRG